MTVKTSGLQISHSYNEKISSAVIWEIIFQLMRRYQQQYDLRVFEIHPGCGQYDCLSLYTCNYGKHNYSHIFDFNLQSSSLHIWNESQHIDSIDIVDEYLHYRNPKELLSKISSMAGLPQIDHLPKSNGPVLAC